MDGGPRVSKCALARVVAGALLLAGCGELIGADDYASERPYHGFLRRMGGDACETCGSACSVDLESCMADSECSAALACLAAEPGWAYGCSIPLSADWELLLRVRACTTLTCKEQCNAGRIWSCAGNYPPPLPKPGTKSVTIDVRYSNSAGNSFPDIEVRACEHNNPIECIPHTETVTTDSAGRAQLEVQLPRTSALDPVPGFRGYLELRSAPETTSAKLFPTLKFFRQRPVWDTIEWSLQFDEAEVAPFLQEPDLGALIMEVADCVNSPAPDVVFEATASQGILTPIYLQGEVPNLALDRTTNGLAVALNVPPGVVHITARLAATQEVVVKDRPVVVRAGTVSIVWLGPDAGDAN
jgi:hypothetical protein